MKSLRFFFTGLLLFGCQQAPIEEGRAGALSVPIVNGTREPMAVPLTDSQVRAIGWLYAVDSPERVFCTGTLIAPNIVVTAAHCTWGGTAGEIGFGVGLEPTEAEGQFLSAGVFPNYEVDAAVILLDEDATASGLDITPIPVNQAALDDTAIGRAVQAGGYGETRDSERTGRWFATVYIDEVQTEEIAVDGRGEQGICFGDSGSGLIDLDSEGNAVVLAVESGGDESCVGIDHMTRLDAIYDWLGPILDGEIPEDPCDGVGREGRCVENVAEWCPRGTLRQTDCTAVGTECRLIEEAGRYGCACDELGDVGWCDGDVAEFCLEGRFIQFNCGILGSSCGYAPGFDEDGYFCIDNPVCRPEDVPGRCLGQTAIRCAGGRTTRDLCYVDGHLCVETEEGAECVDPGGDGDADGDVDGDGDIDGDGDADAESVADAGEDASLNVEGSGGGCSCGVASLTGEALDWQVVGFLAALSLGLRRLRR